MTMTVTKTRVLEGGPRWLAIQVVASDPASTTAGTIDFASAAIVTAASNGVNVHSKIRRILFNCSNCIAYLSYAGSTAANDEGIGTFGPGWGDYNLDYARSGTQGLANTATGATGDIKMQVTPTATVTAGSTLSTTAGVTLTLFITQGAGITAG